jgi:hypothetical protein
VPRVINADKHAGYPPAIVQLKADGVLEENCRHRPVSILITFWNRTIAPSSGGSTPVSIPAPSGELGAQSPAMKRIHMIRKGQACWSATGVKVGLLHRFIVGMFGMKG